MEQQGLKELLKKGFAAMKAGSNVAAKATDEIQDDAKNEGLRNALQQGNEQSKVWAQQLTVVCRKLKARKMKIMRS